MTYRLEIEARLTAIRPANYGELDTSQRNAWATHYMRAGLVRLDDATLTERYRLKAASVAQMPIEDCATFARNLFTGEPTVREELVVSHLRVDQLEGWFGIATAAIEAQAQGTPVPRLVTTEEMLAVAADAKRGATPAELASLAIAKADFDTNDALACAGARALSAVTLRLTAASIATVAREEIQLLE